MQIKKEKLNYEMGEKRWKQLLLCFFFLEKTYYILCIMIERGRKEIIDQLLFLVSKCLQFLSLFLRYRTSFIDFRHDMEHLRFIII